MKSNNPAIKTRALTRASKHKTDVFHNGALKSLRSAAEKIWAGPYYEPALLLIAISSMILSKPYGGCIIMALCASFMLVFCSDILTFFMPFMMASVMSTGFYSNYGSILRYSSLLAVVGLSVIAHFLIYRAPIKPGKMTVPLAAVSASTILGGIGRISLREYFSGTSMYYVLGLGAFLLAVYLFLFAQFGEKRSYDLTERFLKTIYLAGMCAASAIFIEYLSRLGEFIRIGSSLYIPYRNFAATIMLMALPCGCRKGSGRRSVILGTLFIYIAMLFTGSRTALVFGTLEIVACAVWMICVAEPKKRKTAVIIGIAILAASAVPVYFLAKTMYLSRLVDGEIICENDSRYIFFAQGIKDYLDAPVFGWGLGNMKNKGIFYGVDGSLVWYHNIVIQYMASLGTVGILSFAYLWFTRARLLVKKKTEMRFAVIMCWLGIVLTSLTNPGEVCPMPTAFIMTTLFTIVERMPDSENKKAERHSIL